MTTLENPIHIPQDLSVSKINSPAPKGRWADPAMLRDSFRAAVREIIREDEAAVARKPA